MSCGVSILSALAFISRGEIGGEIGFGGELCRVQLTTVPKYQTNARIGFGIIYNNGKKYKKVWKTKPGVSLRLLGSIELGWFVACVGPFKDLEWMYMCSGGP